MSTPPALAARWPTIRIAHIAALAIAVLLGSCTWSVAQVFVTNAAVDQLKFEVLQVKDNCYPRGISIRNTAAAPIMLDGWEISGYPIPRVTIQPGETITFWAGAGTDGAAEFYANRPDGLWWSPMITRPPRFPWAERTVVAESFRLRCDLVVR